MEITTTTVSSTIRGIDKSERFHQGKPNARIRLQPTHDAKELLLYVHSDSIVSRGTLSPHHEALWGDFLIRLLPAFPSRERVR